MSNRMNRDQQRQRWMAEFERLVVAARPDLVGRVDWDTARFLFDQDLTPVDAAARIPPIDPTTGRPANLRRENGDWVTIADD